MRLTDLKTHAEVVADERMRNRALTRYRLTSPSFWLWAVRHPRLACRGYIPF